MINSFLDYRRLKKNLGGYIFFLLLLISLPFSLSLALNKQELRGRAGNIEQSVSILLYPKNITAAKGESFSLLPQIVGPGTKKISSAYLSVNFDKTHIRFVGTAPFQLNGRMKYLKISPVDAVNATGNLKLFAGATDYENSPLGVAHLSPLNFETVSLARSTITLNKSEIQVTFTSGEKAEIMVDSGTDVSSLPIISPTFIPSSGISPSVTTFPSASPSIIPANTASVPAISLTPILSSAAALPSPTILPSMIITLTPTPNASSPSP